MKTTLIPIIGDPKENLYQLGLKEKESFLSLEKRIKQLLSTNFFLNFGQDLLSKTKILLTKKENSFFDDCIQSYSQGLGIEPLRYYSFLSLFELAAHYGQLFPELKGILPGCTSVFRKTDEGIFHTRLLDFPLIDYFEKYARLYYWQTDGRQPILSYSCEGLAPIFLQGLHGAGISFAIHHKPGETYHDNGQSIFKIVFESVFSSENFLEIKKSLKKHPTITKWSVLLLNKEGSVNAIDLDGPSQHVETFHLNDSSSLIFTNIPLLKESHKFNSFIKFSEDRQMWAKEIVHSNKKGSMLDSLTNIENQKNRGWIHPCTTLSTIGAWEVNLTKGYVDIKEGSSALTASDRILRLELSEQKDLRIIKEKGPESNFERGWKKAALAQSYFDKGEYDEAYHELQMAISLIHHPVWKEILTFYLCVWDFKFIVNKTELALIYKKLKTLRVPLVLKDQYTLLIMRFEKKLELIPTVTNKDVSEGVQELFLKEAKSSKPLFATWMNLLYPRMEILDVFSPHN